MATDVVGMAKTVVEVTVARAQAAIEEEAKLRQSVQGDGLVFITGEIQMMQSFLAATDEELAQNDVVRSWVRQVRELAYDVEDCIEFVVHLDQKPSWWFRMLPSCVAPPLPLDEADAEIRRLKARVVDVSQRNARYSLATGSKQAAVVARQPAAGAAPPFDVVQEARDTARRQRGAVDLVDLVANKVDTNLLVISLWGTGGDLGTAFNIKKAYDDADVRQAFGFRGWAKLARPFNLDDFLRCLLLTGHSSATTTSDHKPDQAVAQDHDHDELVKDFARQVEEKRYLVVVEDVSTVLEWEAIRACLPDKKNGSRVVVSTAQLEIATLCTPQPWGVSELAHLSADHSICVFYCNQGRESFETGSKNKETLDQVTRSSFYRDLDLMRATKNITFDKMKLALDWEGIVGRERESYSMDELFSSAESYTVKVISVWGIAGAGKSALTRDLYYRKVKQPAFARCGWVDVPRPFDLRELSRSLLLDLCSEHLHAKNTGTLGMLLSNFILPRDADFDLTFNLKKRKEFFEATIERKLRSLQSSALGFIDPIDECRRLLLQEQCLVVIDGVRSTEEWDLIKAAFVTPVARAPPPVSSAGNRSCIMVVTSEESVAAHCAVHAENVHNVKGLGAAESLRLFKKEVLKNNSHSTSGLLTDDGMEEQAKLLVDKCGGLPQVIVAIGASLAATWPKSDAIEWLRELNDNFMPELETNPRFENLHGLFNWMHSYFRTCPDYLKPCIFYLSIFPGADEGLRRIIRRRRLVGRWIAEGYSRDKDGRAAEERGEMFFSELIGLSIIQQPPETATATYLQHPVCRMVSFQINGFFREYIRSRPMEDNLVFALEGHCSIRAARCSRGRHLAVRASWDRDQNVYDAIDFSRLRSLTVFGEWRPFLVSGRMRLLRVLDLEDTSGLEDDHLDLVVTLVPRLKFLSLRGCTGIRRLPDSIGDLTQLETLDARYTSVATLPTAIARLQKLQYLRAGSLPLDTLAAPEDGPPTSSTTPRLLPKLRLRWQPRRPAEPEEPRRRVGVEAPRGGIVDWKTKSLHTLGIVDVGGVDAKARRGLAVLEELKNLTQLRKLGVSGINRANTKVLLSSISRHGHLRSLSVRLDYVAGAGDGNNEEQSPLVCPDSPLACSDFSPPEKLQSLKLYYGLAPNKLPPWIHQLHNLSKLYLHIAILDQDDIYVLGVLPNLRALRLCLQPEQECDLHFSSSGSFKRLTVLEIACNSKLQEVIFRRGAMDFVEVLKVRRCCGGSSSLRFTQLINLVRIKRIFLKYCEEQVVENMKTEICNNFKIRKPDLELE